jgi:glycosyltransferase involved in cell wall biosynthesis
MNEKATVSVILPVYNGERYVGQAVRGVIDQSFPDWELVVVDDGSTDGTAGAIRRISDDRIRFIHRPENSGPSAARNIGLNVARGRWVAFLDADDAWDREYLKKIIGLTGQYPKSFFGSGIVMCVSTK